MRSHPRPATLLQLAPARCAAPARCVRLPRAVDAATRYRALQLRCSLSAAGRRVLQVLRTAGRSDLKINFFLALE